MVVWSGDFIQFQVSGQFDAMLIARDVDLPYFLPETAIINRTVSIQIQYLYILSAVISQVAQKDYNV